MFKPGTMTGRKPLFVQFTKGEPAYDMDWNNLAPSIGVAWRPHIGHGLAQQHPRPRPGVPRRVLARLHPVRDLRASRASTARIPACTRDMTRSVPDRQPRGRRPPGAAQPDRPAGAWASPGAADLPVQPGDQRVRRRLRSRDQGALRAPVQPRLAARSSEARWRSRSATWATASGRLDLRQCEPRARTGSSSRTGSSRSSGWPSGTSRRTSPRDAVTRSPTRAFRAPRRCRSSSRTSPGSR